MRIESRPVWQHTKTYVVVPAHNEENVLGLVLTRLAEVVAKDRIIVVDDGSSDSSLSIARNRGVVCLRHAINCGQGAALATGIQYALHAGADIVVTFDADGQHCALDIPKMVEPIAEGLADVTLGNRFCGRKPEGIGTARHFILKLGAIFTRLVSGIKVADCQNGMRAFSRNAAQLIRIRQDRMAHASEILDEVARHKLRYLEIPVTVCYTPHSIKKGQRNSCALDLGFKFLISKLVGYCQ